MIKCMGGWGFMIGACGRLWAGMACLMVMTGCATYVYSVGEKTGMDPALRRVVLFNDSGFYLQEEGIFNQGVWPGGRLSVNVACYKRLEGLVDAYKIIGRDEKGERTLEWYGQRRYQLTTDGKNSLVRGVDADAFIIFDEHDFYPGHRSELWVKDDPCADVRLKLQL